MERLATTRIPDDHPAACDAEALSGQKARHSTLQELLRRPHVHYG